MFILDKSTPRDCPKPILSFNAENTVTFMYLQDFFINGIYSLSLTIKKTKTKILLLSWLSAPCLFVTTEDINIWKWI